MRWDYFIKLGRGKAFCAQGFIRSVCPKASLGLQSPSTSGTFNFTLHPREIPSCSSREVQMVGLMVVEVFKNATDLQLGVGYMTKILFDDMNKVIW